MKLYKWGADREEPIEIWSKYDENGNLNTDDQPVEQNKGLISGD